MIPLCEASYTSLRLYARLPTDGFTLHFPENMEMSSWSRAEFRLSSCWLNLWLMLSLGWDFTCYYLHISEWKSRSSLLSCLFYARPPALKVPFFSKQLNDNFPSWSANILMSHQNQNPTTSPTTNTLFSTRTSVNITKLFTNSFLSLQE